MSYIGIPPQANFSSGLLDRFTSTTGTTVTLTHDIASENDIVVFVNFVKQDSTTYSVGGTGNKTLTLGGTLVSSDIVEVHYLNIVGQTVNPSANSVGSSQLTADSITGQTAETSIADDDTIIIHDTSDSALKKMTKANFTSGIGGNMTPAFAVKNASDQSISNASSTKVTLGTEILDSNNAFASDKFTVPSGEAGRYLIMAQISISCTSDTRRVQGNVYKNGSSLNELEAKLHMNTSNINDGQISFSITGVLDLAVSDYLELYGLGYTTSGGSLKFPAGFCTLAGIKIIE